MGKKERKARRQLYWPIKNRLRTTIIYGRQQLFSPPLIKTTGGASGLINWVFKKEAGEKSVFCFPVEATTILFFNCYIFLSPLGIQKFMHIKISPFKKLLRKWLHSHRASAIKRRAPSSSCLNYFALPLSLLCCDTSFPGRRVPFLCSCSLDEKRADGNWWFDNVKTHTATIFHR